MNYFDPKRIIDSFKCETLLKFDKLIDFCPALNSSKDDQEILNKWKKFFSEKNIPWAVTEEKAGSKYILWKENLVEKII